MDNAKFSKFARECKVLNKKCTKTDIDLIFTKIKTKGQRKIDFKTFMKGIGLIAEKRRITTSEVESIILGAGGPKTSNTHRAENVRFHDDKDAYTGVYRHGGPNTNDKNITLSNLADRSAADIRGRKVATTQEMPPPVPVTRENSESDNRRSKSVRRKMSAAPPLRPPEPGLVRKKGGSKKRGAKLKSQLENALATIERLKEELKTKDEQLKKAQESEINSGTTIADLVDENQQLREKIEAIELSSGELSPYSPRSNEPIANAQKKILQLKKQMRQVERVAKVKEQRLITKVGDQAKEIEQLKIILEATKAAAEYDDIEDESGDEELSAVEPSAAEPATKEEAGDTEEDDADGFLEF